MTTPVQGVLDALHHIGHDARRKGRGWLARCPSHDDDRPSLSIDESRDHRALLICRAGCETATVLAALGLRMGDLFPHRQPTALNGRKRGRQRPRKPSFTNANDAVAALERRRGRRSWHWVYHDALGEPVGLVVRWDREQADPATGIVERHKDILPVSRGLDGRWRIEGMPKPRPLYRLPALLDAEHVYVVEGEKAADALWSIGLVATTSPHGSRSAHKANWKPLAGTHVTILPDYDDAGRDYANAVVDLLALVEPAPSVRVVELPGLPPGGDAFDYIQAHGQIGADHG